MKLTNEIKAALIVTLVLALGGLTIVVSTYLPWYILPSIVLVYMVYIMYQLILTKLDTEEKIKEIK
jgi:hypothetical protein